MAERATCRYPALSFVLLYTKAGVVCLRSAYEHAGRHIPYNREILSHRLPAVFDYEQCDLASTERFEVATMSFADSMLLDIP